MYSPELGRFLNRDVLAYDYQNPVELNRYVYGANNPVRFTDPSGYSVMGDLGTLIKNISSRSAAAIHTIGMSTQKIYYHLSYLIHQAGLSLPGIACLLGSVATEADLGLGYDIPIDDVVGEVANTAKDHVRRTGDLLRPLVDRP